MVVVYLAEVHLSCFDQVLLLFSEEHRLHHLPSLRFLLSISVCCSVCFCSRFSRDASYCKYCNSSNSPNADSFLYATQTYVFYHMIIHLLLKGEGGCINEGIIPLCSFLRLNLSNKLCRFYPDPVYINSVESQSLSTQTIKGYVYLIQLTKIPSLR